VTRSFFTDAELACRCCGELNLAEGFREKLNELRIAVNHPMTVTSCCRCQPHNSRVGGKPSSFHLTTNKWGCCAADISCHDWTGAKRWKFIKTAMEHGWSIGINWTKGFIHLDIRDHYPASGFKEPMIFPY